MHPGIVLARGKILEALRAGEGLRSAGRQYEFTDLEHLPGSLAAQGAIVYRILQTHIGRSVMDIAQAEGKVKAPANRHFRRTSRRFYFHPVQAMLKAEERQRIRMPPFEQAATGVAHDPVRSGMMAHPAGSNVQHQFRVVFGDVVEVIGHRTAHGFRWVVFQIFQHRQDRRGGFFQYRNTHTPWQAGPESFARQAAHHGAFVLRPVEHLRVHALRVAQQVRPYGKLRARPAGHFPQSGNGNFRGIQTKLLHEIRDEHVLKVHRFTPGSYQAPGAFRQNTGGPGVIIRQHFA